MCCQFMWQSVTSVCVCSSVMGCFYRSPGLSWLWTILASEVSVTWLGDLYSEGSPSSLTDFEATLDYTAHQILSKFCLLVDSFLMYFSDAEMIVIIIFFFCWDENVFLEDPFSFFLLFVSGSIKPFSIHHPDGPLGGFSPREEYFLVQWLKIYSRAPGVRVVGLCNLRETADSWLLTRIYFCRLMCHVTVLHACDH